MRSVCFIAGVSASTNWPSAKTSTRSRALPRAPPSPLPAGAPAPRLRTPPRSRRSPPDHLDLSTGRGLDPVAPRSASGLPAGPAAPAARPHAVHLDLVSPSSKAGRRYQRREADLAGSEGWGRGHRTSVDDDGHVLEGRRRTACPPRARARWGLRVHSAVAGSTGPGYRSSARRLSFCPVSAKRSSRLPATSFSSRSRASCRRRANTPQQARTGLISTSPVADRAPGELQIERPRHRGKDVGGAEAGGIDVAGSLTRTLDEQRHGSHLADVLRSCLATRRSGFEPGAAYRGDHDEGSVPEACWCRRRMSRPSSRSVYPTWSR